MTKNPLVLAILDGYGISEESAGNAIFAARTPVLDELSNKYSVARLKCSGTDVGLPAGQIGNSEVGHTNMGAGRVVYQDLTRISKSIEEGDFYKNPAFLAAISHAKENGGALHLMGLCSNGGVHSHMSHIFALMDLCAGHKVATRIHCFLDGRDTMPGSGSDFVRQIAEKCQSAENVKIASVMGRFYAMDRDKRFNRLKKAYDAVVLGEAPFEADPVAAVEKSYKNNIGDEFMLPVVTAKDGAITAKDGVIFFNFRPDRARELTSAIVDDAFTGFPREKGAVKPFFVCMCTFDADMPNVQVAFQPENLHNIFGQYIASQGLSQLRIAETEKYAHVTFFFNGGEEKEYPNEDRILIPSPSVETYDQLPEMSAPAVTEQCCAAILSGKYDVIILNLANCDMVGHTGDYSATVKAVEVVDSSIGKIYDAVQSAGGTLIITADHGNAEKMEEQGMPFTAHTTNQVPLIICKKGAKPQNGALCDIAPTMLSLLNLEQPKEMTGRSLLL